ncbi:MAG: hypothetical protein V1735_03510 [Nanoarchaeota archaeon]
MKKALFFLVLAVLLTTSVIALDEFEVTAEPVKSIVFFDGVDEATIRMTIKNNLDMAAEFTIDSPNVPDWDFYTEPRTDYVVTIGAMETKTVVVKMRPLYVGYALYRLFIDVKSRESGTRIRSIVPIEVQHGTTEQREYLPDVRMSATLAATEVDPREQLVIRLTIKNNNPRPIENLHVDVISLLSQQQLTLALSPNEERKQEVRLSFNPFTMPAKDAVSVTASYFSQNETFTWELMPMAFNVMAYSELESQERKTSGFLKKETTLTYTNRGNIERSTLVTQGISPFVALFTATEPKTKLRSENGKYAYYWNINLRAENEAGPQTVAITIKQNYLPVLYAAIIILLIILAYFKFRSPVIVKKHLSEVHRSEDKAGGIFKMKVVIHIKNRTKSMFEQLRVVDHIPNITQLESDFAVGTVKPTRIIAKHARATLVIWELNTLEPFEERIITYQLTSSLHIIGGIDLPAATVKFKDRRGVMLSKQSNRIAFNEGT